MRNKHSHRIAAAIASAMLAIATWSSLGYAVPKAQLDELYELQAAFHRAGTVHDPVNGDSAEAIDQRIRDMMALWTSDGSALLDVGSPRDGTYTGVGDPEDATTCPPPSADPSNRGTLCTFFKYVSGSFQPANKFVSLAPSYLTKFTVHGKNATVFFECHFFNVAIDPDTQAPLWAPTAHLTFDGTARRVKGKWLFSHGHATVPDVPIP